MKFAVIVGSVPNPTSGGGALTAWSVIKSLVDNGHTVTVCIVPTTHTSPSRRAHEAQVSALTRLGVRMIFVEGNGPSLPEPGRRVGRLLRILEHCIEDYYPTVRLTSSLRSILEAESPDGVFVYHFESLAAAYQVEDFPILAAVGDPTHLPGYYAWRSEPPRLSRDYARHSLATALTMLRVPGYMREMMSKCDRSGAFAAHHAAWFRENGVPKCQYFRTPVVDEVGSDWWERRRRYSGKGKFKLLLVGHLKGTATLSGLYLFARDVLPILERELGSNRFEVHVVGGYSPKGDLSALLNRSSVVMRGQVEPATEEFLSSDVLIVPTPIKLGIRVRIISGFSFGCCVVSHQSNALGIPEMMDGVNALLAKSGKEMAKAVLEALDNPMQRERLQVGARKTYEEFFTARVAGARLCAELEEIGLRRKPAVPVVGFQGLGPQSLTQKS